MNGPRVAALVLAILVGGVTPALAEQQTVTLRVDMWCASCPYIIRRSLERVPGVADVTVSYGEQTATVTFDDERTNVAALTAATAEVGFPATPAPAN
jgi:mercuric ion binding protein